MPLIAPDTLLTWIGITANPNQAHLLTELLSEGFDSFSTMETKQLSDLLARLERRTNATGRVLLATPQRQRLFGVLMHLQDQVRLGDDQLGFQGPEPPVDGADAILPDAPGGENEFITECLNSIAAAHDRFKS